MMWQPGLPVDEAERLSAVRDLNLLDTAREERFDRLARIARRVFDVPIVMITMVDEDRQFFKSRVGLDVLQTSRDISFCGHTILGNETFVIDDATQDERFHDNPLVTGNPNIRFYAGVPLRHLNGHKLGTLCIIDQKPRSLDDEEFETLTDLAAMTQSEMGAIELATIDDLTKISNRRGFIALAQNSVSLCARQAAPV